MQRAHIRVNPILLRPLGQSRIDRDAYNRCLVLLSLLAIRIVVRVLGATFQRSKIRRATERSVAWLAWLVVVLWVLGWLGPLVDALQDLSWEIGPTQMSLLGVIQVVLASAAVLVASLWISSAVERRLLRHAGRDDLSVRKMAANLVRALLLFVGLMLVLPTVGVDLTALSAARPSCPTRC